MPNHSARKRMVIRCDDPQCVQRILDDDPAMLVIEDLGDMADAHQDLYHGGNRGGLEILFVEIEVDAEEAR